MADQPKPLNREGWKIVKMALPILKRRMKRHPAVDPSGDFEAALTGIEITLDALFEYRERTRVYDDEFAEYSDTIAKELGLE